MIQARERRKQRALTIRKKDHNPNN